MEVHQIRYFLAVASSGSFTAAAQKNNVSQPSLSAQIIKLEDELGGRLFDRIRKGVRLTRRGELFLPRAQEIMMHMEAVYLDMKDFDQMNRGSISLGCLPTTGAWVLPPLLAGFRQKHPGIDISLTEGSSPVLAAALIDRQTEAAILDEAALSEGIEARKLFSEPLYLALHPGHPLCKLTVVPMAMLAEEPLILMRRGHGFTRIVLSALEEARVQPRVVYESSEIETVQALVRAGLGSAMVPAMICHHSDLVYRPLNDPSPSRTLYFAWRKGSRPSPAMEALLEMSLSLLPPLFGAH